MEDQTLYHEQVFLPNKTIFNYLQRQVTGANIIQLCLEWAADLVSSSETSLPQLLKIKVFTQMIDTIVQTGYHHLNSVTSAVAASLTSVFAVLPPTQVWNK